MLTVHQKVDLAGRILYMSNSAELMHSQLKGGSAKLTECIEQKSLRDDISTDEITPVPVLVHFDEKLAAYVYSGYKAGEDKPIGIEAVRRGGFSVVVAGKRYGKGSSREHSPAAEKLAGVKLVVAESFERIYRQNADNIGLFTSTDFSLITRLERGEQLELSDLTAGRDELASEILACGGLLKFGRIRMRDVRSEKFAETSKPRTYFQKIVDQRMLHIGGSGTLAIGEGGFVSADWRFIHEYYTAMAANMLKLEFGTGITLKQPDAVLVFEDHTSYVESSPAHIKGGLIPNVLSMIAAQRTFVADHHLRFHRTLTEKEAAEDSGQNVAGISHAMMTEHYALPGQVVVGTDSHTPHCGALGCVAFGVGTTDMANAFMTGAVRFTMPSVVRVELNGDLASGVTAKDIVLHLLALPYIRSGDGVGKVFEFCGSAVRNLGIDERATLTNMTAELGGFTGIVAPDEHTVRFLKERRGIDFQVKPWMRSDAEAPYSGEIYVDCSTIAPMVASPGDPGNGVSISSLKTSVPIDIAYGGSCTAGKREDFDHYHEVLSWALKKGLRIPSGVSLFLQYGTTAVRDYCVSMGYHRTFAEIGARILQPSCGACANCGPGSSQTSEQVTVSAINRNFPGRSGPGKVWLASPPTVAASAIAGELMSFDMLRRSINHLPTNQKIQETL